MPPRKQWHKDDPMLKFLDELAAELGYESREELNEVRIKQLTPITFQISVLKNPRSKMIYVSINRGLS